MKTTLLSVCLLAAPLLVSEALAQQMYKWKDAKGVTHFSENPPPDGAAAEKIEVKPVGGERPAVPPPTPRPQKEPEAKPTKAAADEAARKNDEEQRAQKCRTYKRELEVLTAGRIFSTNDKGERVAMEETERFQRIDEAKRIIRESCQA